MRAPLLQALPVFQARMNLLRRLKPPLSAPVRQAAGRAAE